MNISTLFFFIALSMIPEIENENEEWFLSQLYLKFGKTYFEVFVFLLFFTFRSYTFILRHYILVFLLSYRFRLSQPQNR